MSTPEEDYSTARFVISRLRVVYGFLTAVGGILIYGATHIYDLGAFVQRTQSHEAEQTKQIEECHLKLKLHAAGKHESQVKQRKADLNVLFTQHEHTRETLLDLLPAKKRSRARREFARQREQEREILSN